MKKLFAVLLSLALVLSLLACSNTQTPSQPTADAPGAETAAPATTEPSGTEEPVTIVYMTQSGMPQVMHDLIAEFEAQNTDVKVQVNEVAANDTYDQLVLATQAGTAPDVYMTFWTISAATNGLAAQLDEFIDMGQFTSRFTPAAQGYGEWDGHIYAIPWRSGASVMFANATLFQNANIDLPTDGWTWDEFYDIAKQLTDSSAGVYGFSMCGDGSDYGTEWQFWPFLLQAGGKILDDTNRVAAFNTPEGAKALEFIVKMIDDGIIPPGIASMNVDQQGELMASGKLALFQDGPWFLSTLQEKAGSNYEIVALPMPTDAASGSIAGGTALGMSAQSQHKEQAWRFIDFMTSDDALNRWCEAFGQVSPLTSIPDTAYFQNENYQILSRQQGDPGTIVANHYPDSDELNTTFRNYLQAAYLHQMTAEEALEAAASEWNVILANFYGG